MKRKILAVMLGLVMAFGLIACSSSDSGEGSVSEETNETENEETEGDEEDITEENSEETLNDTVETESDTESESGTEETEETSVISIHNTIESASQYKGTFAVGYDHVVGLLQNGTAISGETGKSEHDAGESAVDDWEGITYVDAGSNVSVGLKSDGTVVVAGGYDTGGMDWYIDRYDVSEWENVIYVAAGENNVAALTEDGSVLLDGQLSSAYKNEAREWTNIDEIVLNDDYIVGLKSDGTVVATGSNKYGECDINDWNDITEIAMGSYHTVGLKSDGTVVAAGNNENGQCDVGEWTDIVSVAATDRSTFGLKSDGTLEVAGAATGVLQWTEIIAIDAHCGNVAGLKSDGTIVIIGTVSKLSGTININDDQSVDEGEEDTTGSEAEVSEENTVEVTADIIKAAAVDEESGVHRYATSITMTEDGITAAIRADGTVAYTGTALDDDSDVYAAMEEWTDIVALAAGDCFILGLKSDGTVVAVENSSYRFFEMSVVDEIDSWTDIVVIVAAGCHALGLKSDGTVVAAGSDEYGESEVGDWSGIVMLAAGDHLSLGLTAAGDVVAVGNNTYRQCEISSSEGKGYVSIAACTSGSYAIRPDGHIVAYGDPDINTADDPISVFASTSFALALQADGTLSHSNGATYQGVATDGWSDVVELTGYSNKLLGRQSDGTVIKSTSEAPEVLWTGEELGY